MDHHLMPGQPEVDHVQVCGEDFIDRGDHTTEGLPEPILTRKQKRNRRNNRQKTVKRQGQLADTIPTTEYSIHHIRAKPTPIRLVQSNEAILRKKKLGGVVRFTKFSDMDSRLQSQLERLSKHLISESEYLNENGNNHSSVGGTMYNSGWRKASTHNEIIGISAAVPKIAGNEASYTMLQGKRIEMERFLATRFANISKVLYENLQCQHKKFCLPSFSSDAFDNIHDFSFASHLSFTLNDFHNNPHCDNDSSTYTFGLWLPIDKRDGQLVTESLQVEGGNFIFPEDRFGLDFSGFDGVVEMIWKADQYSHHTEKSTSSSHHTRLGLSCEIPSTTLQTIVRLQNGYYSGEEVFYRDIAHILEDCEAWKEKQEKKKEEKKLEQMKIQAKKEEQKKKRETSQRPSKKKKIY
ncbi:hypothetical protein MJO29_002411 [Puccinia striiformis f. sp. tritici]|nr:hypothetical protein MJO29_002411 [Puccinia striiformis f. sp. tritici]